MRAYLLAGRICCAIAEGISLNGRLGDGVGGSTIGACLSLDVGKQRLHDSAIQSLGATERGELEPDNEDGLEGEVPREVVKDDTERKALEEVEEAEDDPVREPLNVIVMRGRLERLHRKVCGHRPAEEV